MESINCITYCTLMIPCSIRYCIPERKSLSVIWSSDHHLALFLTHAGIPGVVVPEIIGDVVPETVGVVVPVTDGVVVPVTDDLVKVKEFFPNAVFSRSAWAFCQFTTK